MSVSSGISGSRSSSHDDTSTSKSSATEGTAGSDSIKRQLAEKESNSILLLRILVIVILVIAAAGVSILVYSISKKAEVDQFQTQFHGASEQIHEAFEAIGKNRISALGSLAVAAIAHGVDHHRHWPFVALSSYQERAFTARSDSGVLQVSINHFVTEDKRDEWEEFAVSEDAQWIQDTIDYQETVGMDNFISDYGATFTNQESYSIAMYNEKGARVDAPREGPYLPTWEISPLLRRDNVNIDDFQKENDGEPARLCMESGTVVLGEMKLEPAGGIDHDSRETAFFAQLLSIAAGEEVEYQGDPMTAVYLPIFDSFEIDRKPVAVLEGIFNWASYLKDILPPNLIGIDVVLNNPCFGSFTYRVEGDYVFPVGAGVSCYFDRFSKLNQITMSH
jgi:type II secretory pathway pseudopilin PulG